MPVQMTASNRISETHSRAHTIQKKKNTPENEEGLKASYENEAVIAISMVSAGNLFISKVLEDHTEAFSCLSQITNRI